MIENFSLRLRIRAAESAVRLMAHVQNSGVQPFQALSIPAEAQSEVSIIYAAE